MSSGTFKLKMLRIDLPIPRVCSASLSRLSGEVRRGSFFSVRR